MAIIGNIPYFQTNPTKDQTTSILLACSSLPRHRCTGHQRQSGRCSFDQKPIVFLGVNHKCHDQVTWYISHKMYIRCILTYDYIWLKRLSHVIPPWNVMNPSVEAIAIDYFDDCINDWLLMLYELLLGDGHNWLLVEYCVTIPQDFSSKIFPHGPLGQVCAVASWPS